MSSFYDALTSLAPVSDAEALNGYQRYEAVLTNILTPEQLQTYADMIRRTGTIRVFEEMSPDELAALPPDEAAIATAVMADTDATMENRRVVALLNQRGQHDVAPDLDNAT
jgi:hypothetical protein